MDDVIETAKVSAEAFGGGWVHRSLLRPEILFVFKLLRTAFFFFVFSEDATPKEALSEKLFKEDRCIHQYFGQNVVLYLSGSYKQ